MNRHSGKTASALGITLVSVLTLTGGSPALGAPGERGCLEAEGRLQISLVSHDLTAQELESLRVSYYAMADVREDYFALAAEIGAEEQNAVNSARTDRDDISTVVTTKQYELAQAQDSGDEQAIAMAHDQLASATDSLARAEQLVLEARAAYDRAIDVPQVITAKERWDSIQAAHETALAAAGISQADLFAFLQGLTEVLVSCDPTNITDPVVLPGPITPAPTDLPPAPTDLPPAPTDLPPDPSGLPPTPNRTSPGTTEPAPSEKSRVVPPAVNPGLNIQTNLASSDR